MHKILDDDPADNITPLDVSNADDPKFKEVVRQIKQVFSGLGPTKIDVDAIRRPVKLTKE